MAITLGCSVASRSASAPRSACGRPRAGGCPRWPRRRLSRSAVAMTSSHSLCRVEMLRKPPMPRCRARAGLTLLSRPAPCIEMAVGIDQHQAASSPRHFQAREYAFRLVDHEAGATSASNQSPSSAAKSRAPGAMPIWSSSRSIEAGTTGRTAIARSRTQRNSMSSARLPSARGSVFRSAQGACSST